MWCHALKVSETAFENTQRNCVVSTQKISSTMASRSQSILNLPEDVLSIVFEFLSPRSFLSFCLTTKATHQFRKDSAYWRQQTSRTFRLPISPLLHADGERWYFLYKKLKTQTRLYTWGKGVKGNLGGTSRRLIPTLRRGPNPRLGRPAAGITHDRAASQWPTETHLNDDIGVVVDLQCGGWSTSVLTSHGKIYCVGILDAANGHNVGEASTEFTRLEYLTQSTSAIRQFSSGRRHILALTDDHEILSWDRVHAKGYKVFSKLGRDFGGTPLRVVAGWADSSAYVPETGIVFWPPVKNNSEDEDLDSLHVQELVIPETAVKQRQGSGGDVKLLTYIILEGFAVWITNESRIFACALSEREGGLVPFELLGYTRPDRIFKDLQGSFRTFAIFTEEGEILMGSAEFIRHCLIATEDFNRSQDQSVLDEAINALPGQTPALQHSGVIQVAFGDYHYHALHADGRITAYGSDPQSCGALGLGSMDAGAQFRGVINIEHGFPRDAKLLPVARLRGRRLWFEAEKKNWLTWMEEKRTSLGESLQSLNSEAGRTIFSEWVEQEGQHWADGPPNAHRTTIPDWSSGPSTGKLNLDYDNLGAFFAISIAAAGWHSGALVLVDDSKAEEARSRWIVTKHSTMSVPGSFEEAESHVDEDYAWVSQDFPKIRLPTGQETPGEGTILPWRESMPTMTDLGLSSAAST